MLDVKRYRRVLVCVGEFEQTGGLAAVLVIYSELNRAVIERCSACNGYLIRTACEIEAVEFDNNVVAYLLNARAVYLVIIAVQIIVVCRRVFRIGTVVLFKLKAAEYAGIVDNKADVVRSAYSARQVEGLGVCSVPSAVILYCKCADISAAVVGIAEIQLYGIIFTAAAVSDAYRIFFVPPPKSTELKPTVVLPLKPPSEPLSIVITGTFEKSQRQAAIKI